MMRQESSGARNKALFVVFIIALFTAVDYCTTPPVINSLEGAALEKSTQGLEVRAEKIAALIAELARELEDLSDDAPTPLASAASRVHAAEKSLGSRISEEEDSLETTIQQNHEKLEGWVHSLGDRCGKDGKQQAAPAKPIPRHPLGGQDSPVIDVAAVNPDSDITDGGRSLRAEEEPDTCLPLPAGEERAACQRGEVKKAFLHSWNAYRENAWGSDELRPLTKRRKNWGGEDRGIGLTILDAVSTIHIMGLEEEFERVRGWVKDDMTTDINVRASQFEYTIRAVGGLLSAYELSGEKHPEFLQKAKELADKLLHAYDTPNGIPHAMVNLVTLEHLNPSWTSGSAVLSEFATVQLEMRTLSYHTEKSVYDEKATWIMDVIEGKAPEDFLCPTYFSTESSRWTSTRITLGALGDSYYEYLLKQFLLTGSTEKRYRIMYEKAAKGIVTLLLKKSYPSGQAYVAELKNRDPSGVANKMDHLACFTGGMLAMGASKLGSPIIKDGVPPEELLKHAEDLAETCYLMYKQQPTGISPEVVYFHGGQDMEASQKTPYYLLRPEAVETFMYLYRVTKKEKYRKYGWEVFRAILRWCKVKTGGFSGLSSVLSVPPDMDDLQQSFWFAETLKYLYLLFSDDDTVNLDEWVFNTEGHPLRVRERDPLDIWPTKARAARKASLVKHIDERIEDHVRKAMAKSGRG
eukprot:TRINITY_DN9727_c0_g1_i1.p1 TRINITY_DN9727_c0_g1~~TRINITY_DN9727_c0_g1_i1.p1  ORF type:complete len:693 (+),score=232.95 TRINITY_DN9727_c0_g1_i1:314-2392(+)